MNGLELARGYYEEIGKPMLERDFSDLLPYLAIGFVGSGSDRYGFDDEISKDHDFEPGFCIFLPDESVVNRRLAFLLERAYAKLPKEYKGYTRQPLSPVGGNRNGVIRTADFYTAAIGFPGEIPTPEDWLRIPDYALAEAVNGAVFWDAYGEFTRIRKSLASMPQDVRLKRIAGNVLIMAQAGQYNFLRCREHGEPEAAQLALFEFVNAAMKVAFLLEGQYMPYYKWSFRALRNLPATEPPADQFSALLSGDLHDERLASKKYETVEAIASRFISLLRERNLTDAVCGDLEKHAYSINDHIRDESIRNLHILAGI